MTDRKRNPLYRNPEKGKIFGVFAGIAESFGWDAWAVRAIVLLVGFFTGFTLLFLSYLVAFFVLDPKPRRRSKVSPERSDSKATGGAKLKERVKEAKATFSHSEEPCSEILDKVELTLMSTQERVEKMEAFVTSGRYELDREFRKMGNSA